MGQEVRLGQELLRWAVNILHSFVRGRSDIPECVRVREVLLQLGWKLHVSGVGKRDNERNHCGPAVAANRAMERTEQCVNSVIGFPLHLLPDLDRTVFLRWAMYLFNQIRFPYN